MSSLEKTNKPNLSPEPMSGLICKAFGKNMNSRILSLGLTLACALTVGCASYEEIVARRHEKLLQIYPLAETSREDVARKWAPTKPELFFKRPLSGWLTLEPRYIGVHLDAVEKRAKKDIASFERYFGVDGFLSLCRCWFYYDADGKLVEVEWQYVSD